MGETSGCVKRPHDRANGFRPASTFQPVRLYMSIKLFNDGQRRPNDTFPIYDGRRGRISLLKKGNAGSVVGLVMVMSVKRKRKQRSQL